MHVGEVHPALLDQCAVLDHPRPATAATGPRPGVLGEARAAVFGLQRSADAVLQIEQIGFDGFGPVVHEITLRMTARSP